MTLVISLCVNLVDQYELISVNLLTNSLKILTHCVEEDSDLAKYIFDNLTEKFLSIFSIKLCPT